MIAAPAGAVWDEPFDRLALCFVDLEMTGLDPKRDRIVQLCLERVVGDEEVGRLFSNVHGPPGAAARISGISAHETAAAPPFHQLANQIEAMFDGAILVAHAATHDIRFLRAEFARLGRSWGPLGFLDTLALSRRVFELPSYSLGALAQALDIDNPRPHQADNDVRVLRAVWTQIMAKRRPRTARELWQASVERQHPSAAVLAEAERAVRLGKPVRVQYRPSGRGPEWLELCVTAVRTDLDPPLVLGYLLRTRGRRQLRANRVLAIKPWDPP